METQTIKFGKQDDGSWIIAARKLDDLRKDVAKMVRRASKTAQLPVALVEMETGIKRWKEVGEGGYTVERVCPWVRVRVDGETPRINGFELIARVGHFGELGNIVNRAPRAHGVALPDSLRTASPTCEHCATARRRKDTFILRSEFGSLHQIGRNCLADFCRSADLDDALAMWRLLAAVECALGGCDDGEGGHRGGDYTSTGHFLACAAKSIRVHGWVSRAMARENDIQATADRADFAAGPCPSHHDAAARWRDGQPEEQDHETAAEVIDWAETLGEREELSDYLSNLRVAVALGYIARKTAGIVASAIPALKREREQEFNRARRTARGPGEHVGTLGKRQEFRLTVTNVYETTSEWGSKTIVGLEDESGNELVWFATGHHELNAGDVLVGKATPKKHGSRNGRAQTVISRFTYEKSAMEAA